MYLTNFEKQLEQMLKPIGGQRQVNRYPLTDIAVDENEEIFVRIACAGFRKEDLTLDLQGRKLLIQGAAKPEEATNVRYIQQHISQNDFVRTIELGERYVNGEINADYKDGLLLITIKPSETPVKTISIN